MQPEVRVEAGDRLAEELTLAVLSLFLAATDLERGACARLIDTAAARASAARTAMLKAAGVADPVRARFGAARAINSLCGACRACPRGRTIEAGLVMTPGPPPPGPGPRPGPKRR